MASLVAQTVKNLPARQEIWVRALGREDPLEKGMATHSSLLAFRIPWTEEPGRKLKNPARGCVVRRSMKGSPDLDITCSLPWSGELQSMGCKESDTTEVT